MNGEVIFLKKSKKNWGGGGLGRGVGGVVGSG